MSTVDLTGARWRKSSYSAGNGNGGNCVEIAPVTAHWRRSSYSGGAGNGGNCVEVAFTGPAMAVRDSKNADGPALTFPLPAWQGFIHNP